jgi:HD-GYP domain-containing protein (c-di-GMP phosphodiesterase class II)
LSTLLRAMFIGVPADAVKAARDQVPGLDVMTCTTKSAFASFLLNASQSGVTYVFIGSSAAEISPLLAAQELKQFLKTKNIYYVTDYATGFSIDAMLKVGYADAFLWPKDKVRIGELFNELVLELEHRSYSAVRLVDIEAGTTISFQIAIYLQANKKYVVYANAGDTLEVERLERLKQHKQNSLYVPVTQIAAFHAYSAHRLKELASLSRADSAAVAKLNDSIHELAMGMLNSIYSKVLGRGRSIDDHAQKIITQFVLLNDPFGWCARLIQQLGAEIETDSHGLVTATFAVLFGVLLGKSRPDDLFAAGLLHDIGLNLLPKALLGKLPDQLKQDELKVYKRHIQLSLDAIRARKISVSEGFLKAIAHHHEKWEGSGYPSGLATKQISIEGQILALADRFYYLTSPAGGAPLSPDQALRQMEKERAIDPDILRTLRLIFERELRVAS